MLKNLISFESNLKGIVCNQIDRLGVMPSRKGGVLKLSLFLGTLTWLSSSVTTVQAASFQGLSDLPGGNFASYGFGVSANGLVAVGSGTNRGNGSEAFRWTQTDGMVGLGSLPSVGGNSGISSSANGVSRDGLVVVGVSEYSGRIEAFRWTQTDGMVGLGDLPGGNYFSFASDVSVDGSVIVGVGSSILGQEAFRWTQTDGMVGLGDLPGGDFFSQAYGVSADASVIVGLGTSVSGSEAFRWTQTDGMIGLGSLPGNYFQSVALSTSANGTVVVGQSLGQAFIWTQSSGMVGLGSLPGPGGSFASRVSANGSVIVGSAGGEAFIWTSSNGMLSLRDMLVAAGINLNGWRLTESTGISADGLTIVGRGYNPKGDPEAWIARLDGTAVAVPTPSLLPMLVGVSFNLWRKRKKVQRSSG